MFPIVREGNRKSAGGIITRFVERGQSTATFPLDADYIRAVALRAVDAAKSAGATYADARLVRIVDQTTVSRDTDFVTDVWSPAQVDSSPRPPQTVELETHAIAVRALVNGAWGFTASPWWTDDEAVVLGQSAVAQARDNAQWTTNRVELAPAPVATGTWTTPLRIDPFTIPVEEKMALVENARIAYRPLYQALDHWQHAGLQGLACRHTTRAVATSEGAYFVQHWYSTGFIRGDAIAGMTGIDVKGSRPTWTGQQFQGSLYFPGDPFYGVVPSGTGWEAVADVDLWSWGEQAAEQAHAALLTAKLPPRPASIGEYTVVMDAEMVARLVDVTVARAADIDRLSGDEANANGTSYFGRDPLQLLGNYSVGNPMVTVTATRAATVGHVSGLPTTRWDDEGVVPTPFTLIKDGVLQDLPTTRDRATVLAPYYQKHGRPVVSNGCATSDTAFDVTTVGPPTLVLQPGAADVTLDAMISSVPRGLILHGGPRVRPSVSTDFSLRQLTITNADTYEIVNGRVGRSVINSAVSIDATQLWKNLRVLGGAQTAGAFANIGTWTKGEPEQSLNTSVVAVPATFTNMPVILAPRTGWP